MLPPRLVERPSITTRAGYFVEGRRRLRSAIAAYPELEPWDALIELHCQGQHIRGKSARKYYQEDRRILEASLRLAKRRERWPALHDQLLAALDQRRLRGAPAYGAGNKIKDATEEEVIAAFREIKRNALATQYMIGVHAALFVLIAAHSAARPVELIGAKIEGAILIVKNAKAKPGLPDTREINLERLPPDVIIATQLLIDIMPPFVSRAEFKRWAKDLAEALARACVKAGLKRRLSLYSFRHIAIATWKKAGLSPREIAILAGHLSEASARHYAGAKHGHDRVAVARSVQSDATSDHATTPEVAPKRVESIAASPPAPAGFWEEPPHPSKDESTARQFLAPEEVKRHYDRIADATDLGRVDLDKVRKSLSRQDAHIARKFPDRHRPNRTDQN